MGPKASSSLLLSPRVIRAVDELVDEGDGMSTCVKPLVPPPPVLPSLSN